MRLERGSKLGPYEILALIGAGGMGVVYRARDLQLGRDVAIKVLPENVSSREDRLARFENEARLASSLNHPNIITIYSMGWQNQRCYIAMELIEGRTLQELMEEGPMPVEQALNIFAQVADGLARAHEAGIIHRDLKPKNVMITKDGHAKILDFGLSKLTRSSVDSEAPTSSAIDPAISSESLTRPGTVLGTVEYMSPEQAAGRPVNYRSDQFSMGTLMYAVLTGVLPFHRESEVQTLNQIIEVEPRPVNELNPRVPEALQLVLRRCLMKDPKDRYKSTKELARDLQRLELDRKMLLRRWTRRDWIRASLVLLILLVIMGSIWIWSQLPYNPKPAAVEWYQKGVTSMHSMVFDSARKFFHKAVEIDPKFALAHASLARAYDEMNYSVKAKEQMMRAMEMEQEFNLSSKDTKRFHVFQFIVWHQYENAAPLLQQLERDADKQGKPAAALECGWLAEKLDDTEGAAEAYERALQINPDFAAAHLRLGYIQQRRGEDELALQNFTTAENLYRTSNEYEGTTESLYQRASFLNRRSRAEEAMESIEEAIDMARMTENRYQEIHLQLLKSSVLRKLGESDRASELAQQTIDDALNEGMDDLATSGMISLGNVFLGIGDYESAEKYFREARYFAQRGKVRRYEAMASVSLGSLFEQKNQPDQAMPFIEEAMSFYKEAGYRREYIQAMAILGGILRQLGSYEKGIEVLREALPQAIQFNFSTSEVRIRERLVELLKAQGNWPEALKESEQFANKFASNAEGVYARLDCAGLYWRLGRWQDAERSLAEVEPLLRDSADPYALSLFRLRQMEMAYARGRFEQAGILARRTIAVLPAAGDMAELDAGLIEALVRIRTGRRDGDIKSALQIVRDFEESRLAGNAASARLAIAEALADIGQKETAKTLALDALVFFEPRSVWESVWRAHTVAARVSEGSADISAHRNAARSALDKMRSLWPANDMDRYLRRADIQSMYGNLDF